MERGTSESLKQQYQLKKALEEKKLRELELIKVDLKVLELQMSTEVFLEEIPKEVKEEVRKETNKWYAIFNGPFPGIYDEWFKVAPHC